MENIPQAKSENRGETLYILTAKKKTDLAVFEVFFWNKLLEDWGGLALEKYMFRFWSEIVWLIIPTSDCWYVWLLSWRTRPWHRASLWEYKLFICLNSAECVRVFHAFNSFKAKNSPLTTEVAFFSLKPAPALSDVGLCFGSNNVKILYSIECNVGKLCRFLMEDYLHSRKTSI